MAVMQYGRGGRLCDLHQVRPGLQNTELKEGARPEGGFVLITRDTRHVTDMKY